MILVMDLIHRVTHQFHIYILWLEHYTAQSTGSVQWYDCNTQQIISGATQNTFVATVTDNYAAIITEGNCIDTSVCMNVVVDGVGELATNNQVNIFPNPTTSQINISSQTKIDKVQITNLLGQVVYQSTPNQKNLTLQLAGNGMYFITVTANNKTVTQKIIVQK